ncbi:PflC2 [Desulforapulum autotrophicum HRM2]|uniref:PflC2 n=1 Tax=Desulforapulum autotrophicum (strain ATCC 43914 / DSM 3382 / VKM B-1955 / HRM2) TaxID=177437 RepID=C0QIN8_DESAH|nr:glycyl-radical enzyme activating protein [Desulforapulum autotrophicum]ACN17982.1 PflC2 [Desulforapulum autotrophicum HRM2]
MTDQHSIIFDIKKYAIHDGPGIRTTVFMNGCPLSCPWCHNPEGLSLESRVTYNGQSCIGCGECVAACPEQALELNENGVARDLVKCINCGHCAEICPANAMEKTGRCHSTDSLMEMIKKDRLFYESSGGGVTFSGGEPLVQWRSLDRLLRGCTRLGIHTAVDTSGYSTWGILEKIAENTDLFLFDLKVMDDSQHRLYTGVSNGFILSNLKKLSRRGAAIIIRFPLISGVNADTQNLEKMGRFVADLPQVHQVDILPYHDFQRAKYHKFGLAYPGEKIEPVSKLQITRAVDTLTHFGLNVHVH